VFLTIWLRVQLLRRREEVFKGNSPGTASDSVEQFASSDATVQKGASITGEMGGELTGIRAPGADSLWKTDLGFGIPSEG